MGGNEPFELPVPLEDAHDRASFSCGEEPLDDFIKRYASQQQKKGASMTHVVLDGHRVVAYYTLAIRSYQPQDVPAIVKKGYGTYTIPAVLLARLAVDTSQKGRGLGVSLLQEAMRQALEIANRGGGRVLFVEAKNEAAARFYQHCGFHRGPEIQGRPQLLYLLMDEVRKYFAPPTPPERVGSE